MITMKKTYTNPTISVVIPAYNGERFIEKAVRSVMNQEYPAHEIIVIDDGSTDSTPGVLDGFGDRIIRRRIKNQGAAAAINEGLGIATGEYIALLDQDDVWFVDKLKVQAEAIRRYPEAGFFCCDFTCRYALNNYRLRKHFSVLRHASELNFDDILMADPFELLIKENFVGTASTVVIRKSVIDRVGGFDKEILVEDFDYWVRCALTAKFVVLSRTLMHKRAHDGNFSNNKILIYSHHKKTLQKIMRKERTYIEANRLSNTCKLALAKTNYQLGSIHYEKGEIKEAFRLYLEGLFSHVDFKNILFFAAAVFKKTIRILTFNKLSKKNTRWLLYRLRSLTIKYQ